MTDEIPAIVADVDDDQRATDVTDEYEDTVEMFMTMAESRLFPVPMEHVVFYQLHDQGGKIVALFVVDTSIDEDFAFEVVGDESVFDAIEQDDVDELPEDRSEEMIMEQFDRSVRAASEAIWSEVVNV